ncbi:MAG: hypothetical protein AAGH83_00700 [Pseudomonadota bacterium]
MAGYTRPAERLAARLARRLNTPEDGRDTVVIEPWLLDRELRQILSERYYQITLVGLDELGLPKPRDEFRTAYNRDQFEDAEAGAGMWLEHVLDAERHIHSSRSVHEAHNILLAFAHRGHGWPDVQMIRAHDKPGAQDMLPPVAKETAAALARQMKVRGNDAGGNKARREEGPLWLAIGPSAVEVIDALSLWAAICCAPPECDVLTGPDEDDHVHMFARAIHGANKHWDALRRLGLSPTSWMARESWEDDGKLTTLSVAQALKALDFVTAAQDSASKSGRDMPELEDYRAAWGVKPILKRLSFDEFEQTRAGRAIIASAPQQLSEQDLEDISYSDEDDPVPLANHSDLKDMIDRLEQGGAFDPLEIRILRWVSCGDSLEVLHRDDKEIRFRFRKLEDLKACLDPLQDRVIAAVTAALQET